MVKFDTCATVNRCFFNLSPGDCETLRDEICLRLLLVLLLTLLLTQCETMNCVSATDGAGTQFYLMKVV